MGTTVRDSGVMAGVARIAETARVLREQLLQPRRVYLKGKAPRCRSVHQLRRDMAAGRVRAIEHLLTVSYADIDQGLSPKLVTQWAHSYIADVEEYAAERQRQRAASDGNLLVKMQRETRAHSVLDEAQLAALAHPDDPTALDAVITASAEYDAAEDTLVSAIRNRRARLTATNTVLAVSC